MVLKRWHTGNNWISDDHCLKMFQYVAAGRGCGDVNQGRLEECDVLIKDRMVEGLLGF
jgi:hypothetical protein